MPIQLDIVMEILCCQKRNNNKAITMNNWPM